MTSNILPFRLCNPVDCNHNGTIQVQRLLGGQVCIKCMRCNLASIVYKAQIRTMGGHLQDIALRYAEASFDAEDQAIRDRAYRYQRGAVDYPTPSTVEAYWVRRRGGRR